MSVPESGPLSAGGACATSCPAPLECEISQPVRTHRSRRRVGTPRTAIVAVGISVLLASCGSDEVTPSASTRDPQPPASATPSLPETVSELEGSWQTDPVSQRDAEAALREQGLTKWIEEFRPLSPFDSDTVLTLVIEDGGWDLYGQPEGRARSEIDYDAEYSVEGNEITVAHADGSRTLRWAVDGDTLTLNSIETTLGTYRGIPDEVFQVALYMSAEFTKQG
jgi:hypothetical protein